MERFINVLVVTHKLSVFRELKSAIRGVGINCIHTDNSDDAFQIVSKKNIGVLFYDIELPQFKGAKEISTLIKNSVNKELFTLLLTPNLAQLSPIIFSIKEGACDYLLLPLNHTSLNIKMEMMKRLYFDIQRVTSLIENVFPKSIVSTFRKHGRVTPRRYENAVILFTDFVGFSSKSAHLKPLSLIRHLERYFTKFDDICDHYQIEKIKTIGDAYMAIAGVNDPLPFPEIRACLAAIEMIEFVETEYRIAEAQGMDGWQIRIGINKGSLVGGIVGRRKLIYDVWGDSVNIASRAEQASSAGRILITQRIFDEVQSYFETEFYNAVEIKKRGGEINMYFLGRIIADFASDHWRKKPSMRLMNLCELSAMDYHGVRVEMLHKLRAFLPVKLTYHSVENTIKFDEQIRRYARLEAISSIELTLLRTAVLFVNSGFIVDYNNNKQYAIMMAKNLLPTYGYSASQIEIIIDLIWVTTRQVAPKNLLEQLICDAGSDYLGRKDYHVVVAKLRTEIEQFDLKMTDEEWIDFQIDFLEFKHRYYSDVVKNIREKGKSKRIEELKEMRLRMIDNEYDS